MKDKKLANIVPQNQKDEGILLSIVVPTWNIPSEIFKRCMNSIANLKNLSYEVLIMIDGDGQHDRYWAICQECFSSPERVKVIEIAHAGLNAVRNAGIKLSQGKWLFIVDADDAICVEGLTLALNALKGASDTVAYCTNHIEVFRSYSKRMMNYCEDERFNGVECCSRLMRCTYNMGQAWAKLFSRDFLVTNHLYYDESLAFGEDCEFILRLAFKAEQNNVTFMGSPVFSYQYYRNADSSTKRFSEDYMNRYIRAFKIMNQDFKEAKWEPKEFDIFVAHVLMQLTVNYVFNANAGMTLKDHWHLYRKVRQIDEFACAIRNVHCTQMNSKSRSIVLMFWKLHLFLCLYAVAWFRHTQIRLGRKRWA